jgi:hypothetical protein
MVFIILGSAYHAYLFAQQVRDYKLSSESAEFLQVIAWVKNNTKPDDIIISPGDRWVYLHGNRQTMYLGGMFVDVKINETRYRNSRYYPYKPKYAIFSYQGYYYGGEAPAGYFEGFLEQEGEYFRLAYTSPMEYYKVYEITYPEQ